MWIAQVVVKEWLLASRHHTSLSKRNVWLRKLSKADVVRGVGRKDDNVVYFIFESQTLAIT